MAIEESETVELKKSTSELKEGIISISSILNKHKAGKLYFGIGNDGSVLGQDVTHNTLRDVSKAISDHIEPRIYPEIKKEVINGKSCVSVAFAGEHLPYFAYGRAYMRVADEDRPVSSSELKKLIIRLSVNSWENLASDKKLADVNKNTLVEFIKKANDVKRINFKFTNVKDILEKLHLIKDGRLLKAAEVLFCDDNTNEIQAAVFAGKDKLTFLDIRQFKGNILQLKEQAQAYIKEHMNWRANLTGTGREEIPEVPLRAIEEAVVNSLCHRDYSVMKGNEVAFFKDRIEIFNVGEFPEGKRPQDYIHGKGESVLRNPLIANTLFLSQDIERWGSGIKRIFESCRNSGVRSDFETTSTGFRVIFHRPENFGGATGGLSEGLNEGLNEGLKSTLLAIKNKPGIKAREISTVADRPLKTIERHISQLIKVGKIERKGSRKTGGYFVLK